MRPARTVEGDRLANERLEGGLVNLFSFVDVDRVACVSVETRLEEAGRTLQRCAPAELWYVSIGQSGQSGRQRRGTRRR